MRKLKWKDRILIAIISGLAFTIVLFIIDSFSNEMRIKSILFQGLFFLIFFGFGFPFIMEKLTKRQLKKIKYPDLNENETIIKEDAANLIHNFFNTIGGKLFLTEKKLIFNSSNSSITIQLLDIIEVNERKTIGMFNNGLRIITMKGQTYDFVVNNSKNWIDKIKK